MRFPLASRSRRVLGTAVAAGLIGTAVLPAVAATLDSPPAPAALDRIAFVARNDVAADALGVGPVAGALGAIVVTTPSGSLSDPAELALTEFAPDHVYIAGGTSAISQAVEDEVAALGSWSIERLAGSGRDETAYLVGKVLADLNVGRPLLTGAQVEGDAYLGGQMHADYFNLQRQVVTSSFDATHDDVDPIEMGGTPADVTTVEIDLPSQSCGITESTVYTLLAEGDATSLASAASERLFRVALSIDEKDPAYDALETTTGTGFDFSNVAVRGEFEIGPGAHTMHLKASTSGSDVTAVRGGLTVNVLGWECQPMNEMI